MSLARVINKPARGIGKTTVDRMQETATRTGTSLYTGLLALREDASQSAAVRKKLAAFVEMLDGLRERASLGPASLARDVLKATGYLDYLRAEDTPEADSRLENIQEVLTSMDQYEADADEPSLTPPHSQTIGMVSEAPSAYRTV